MNDSNISFRQTNQEIEMRIINGSQINSDEVDETLPFGIPEFEMLPIFN